MAFALDPMATQNGGALLRMMLAAAHSRGGGGGGGGPRMPTPVPTRSGGVPPGDFAADPRFAAPDLGRPMPVSVANPQPVGDLGFEAGGNAARTLASAADVAPIKDGGGGFFGRIGDFLKSDEGRATMMRFAAGAANGGLGGGLTAATGFADQRRAARDTAAEHAADRGIRQQEADQTGQYQRDRVGVDRDQLGEQQYEHDHPSAGDVIRERGANYRTRVGETGANYRTGVQAKTTQRGQDLDYSIGHARIQEDARQYDTPSANTVATQAGEDRRAAMGIGSKSSGTRTMSYTIPGEKQGGFLGMGGTTSPDVEVKTEVPLSRPSEVAPGGASSEVRYDSAGMAYVQGPNGSAVRAPQFDRR